MPQAIDYCILIDIEVGRKGILLLGEVVIIIFDPERGRLANVRLRGFPFFSKRLADRAPGALEKSGRQGLGVFLRSTVLINDFSFFIGQSETIDPAQLILREIVSLRSRRKGSPFSSVT